MIEDEATLALWRASRSHDANTCDMCRAVRRRRLWLRIRTAAKWTLIVGLPIIAFYYR